MMKKTIVVFLTLVLLLTQLTSMTYPTETDSSSISNNTVVSASEKSPYEKIHVYTHQDDENDYSCIKNESELSAALHALKSYTASLTSEKVLQKDQSDIRITVEFASVFSKTEEYIAFRDQLSKAKSIAEVREIRKKLNSFSKKYHAELIKSNAKLLSAMEYDTIDEVGYSPFVVMETTQDTLVMFDLVNLARNDEVQNITLESAIEIAETNSTEQPNQRANNAITDSAVPMDWDEMLECIGAKNTVDDGVYQGEDIIIGIVDIGALDLEDPNLVGKDIHAITNTTSSFSHGPTTTAIIARIAPQATIFYDVKHDGHIDLSNLIDQYCDVINLSIAENSREYSPAYDGIMDYQVYHHQITIVKTAGNQGSSPLGISSPGNAYNVITVGGVQRNANGDIVYCPYSSYSQDTNIIKPNVCGVYDFELPNAPGLYDIVYGTSVAAPQVTACVALIQEIFIRRDGIWLMPYQIMALLMSGAEETDDYMYVDSWYNKIDRRVGAGVINLDKSVHPRSWVDTAISSCASANDVVYSKQIHLNRGEELQVANVVEVQVFKIQSNGESIGSPSDFNNYNIYLYSVTNQTYVGYTVTSPYSNFDLFRYVATYSGDYIVEIRISGAQTTTPRWLGVAYTIK